MKDVQDGKAAYRVIFAKINIKSYDDKKCTSRFFCSATHSGDLPFIFQHHK